MPEAAPRPCVTHADLVAFKYPLSNLSESLKRSRKIKIVAIGSSSTAGADGIVPYPQRLELLLRTRHYGQMIDVVNRGIGGQESPEELSRLECDVIAEAPSLVIWQVGTNAVYHSYNLDEVRSAIAAGLGWLTRLPMDVVLMDLQYTKAMVDHIDQAEKVVKLIQSAADEANGIKDAKSKVNVFRRWSLMKRWYEDGVPLSEMDDGADAHLHTSDWATACVTKALDEAMAAAPPPAA
jgi:lysophospholipase L1-like esterase